MMRHFGKILLGGLTLATVYVAPLQAEEPLKFQNVTWHQIVFLKFKPGTRVRAGEILEYEFVPARRAAGLPTPSGMHFASGGWDMIYDYPMRGGPSDLIWEVSPDDLALEAALAKKDGVDKAKALLSEWRSLIDREEHQIAHVHADW
jgi:hypothetical protein